MEVPGRGSLVLRLEHSWDSTSSDTDAELKHALLQDSNTYVICKYTSLHHR
jgi:hypothetical protein